MRENRRKKILQSIVLLLVISSNLIASIGLGAGAVAELKAAYRMYKAPWGAQLRGINQTNL